MRILIVSDIHSNWPALRTIDEAHDVCLCLGDLVDYGLEPAACIDWVRTRAQQCVRGNHDHGVAQNVVVTAKRGFKYLTSVTRPLTRERLGADDLRWLGRIPVTRTVTLDGTRILLVHATPRDPLDEYAPGEMDLWSRRLDRVEADVVCVGHTHQPFVLEIGNQLVVNPGSVGLPRDGDPRGSYAVLENREVTLKRFDYPVEDTIKVIADSTLPDQAKEMLAQVYRHGEVK